MLLHELFVDNQVATVGIKLQLGEGETVVHVSFGALLGDEEALSTMAGGKGAGGLCPCLKCSITNKPCHTDVASNIASLSERDPTVPNIATSDVAKLGLRTDEDIWSTFDSLEGLAAADREFGQHISGLKFSTDGLLYDKPLRRYVRPTLLRYDAMHILFSNGLVGVEMKLVLDTMSDTVGGYFEHVRGWIAEHNWVPRTTCFSESREAHATHAIKAGASELLSDYPLLRQFFLEFYGHDAMEPAVKSFLALCDCADVVRYIKRGAPYTIAESLPSLVSDYLAAFIEAHGYECMRFKHHQLVHLHEQIMTDKMSVDCWVNERKNIKSKEAMAHNRSKMMLESSALARSLNAQVRMLESPGWVTALAQPSRPFPELAAQFQAASVELSRGIRWSGINISNGDFVFLDWDRLTAVLVIGCLAIDTGFALLVRRGTEKSRETHSSTWQIDAEVVYHMLVEGASLVGAAFYKYVGPNRVALIH